MTQPALRAPDPATDPGMRAVPEGATVPTRQDPSDQPTVPAPWDHAPRESRPERPAARSRTRRPDAVLRRSRTGVLWTGLILSALVLLFLLIFILQNTAPVQITFLGMTGTLPTGVALLLAAIAGLLLVAIPGGLRILQLRKAAQRGTRRVR